LDSTVSKGTGRLVSGARLRIEDLTIIYDGEHTAVESFDIDVQPGELVTLLGPSGSGKTSVLMAIAGFVDAACGRVSVDDTDLLALPPNQRNLGMVFQDYALFPHMSVAENIGFPLKMRQRKAADIAAAVEEALQMVRLVGYEQRRPTQLSGGEQQRVALARATIFNPPVLLMDEPLGALDKQLRDQLQFELKQIQQRTGITTLYVTHDQSEAMMLADRIAVMREGLIEQIGTPAELYEQPANRFVAEFIGESNVLTGSIQQETGSPVLELSDRSTLPLPDQQALEAGSQIDVVIRPERLALDDADRQIQRSATIGDVAYAGEMFRITVLLDNGCILTVKQQNRGQAGTYRAGQQVMVGWDPDDMTVLGGTS
jgi:putative spermidine/putrescine transport system ATP-binding protein